MATQQQLGLFRIESAVASHWTAQYFVNGGNGVAVIKLAGDSAKTAANVRAALDQQAAGLPAELITRIASVHLN